MRHFRCITRMIPGDPIRNVNLGILSMTVSRQQIVFPMGELTGNIWITEYKQPGR